jgi:uncharacterized membrane protein
MIGFTALDALAFAFFVCAWLGYKFCVESQKFGKNSLNAVMRKRREAWFRNAAHRDNRIVDTQIMASLQNGAAFFASTSLLAIGGALAMLQSTESILLVFVDLPLGHVPTRGMWEAKVIGMATIFAYAFFKFAWSYRVFNYSAILLGAIPDRTHHSQVELDRAASATAAMNAAAAQHFNRGQRGFFFAIAYLGWFLGPLPFIVATLGVLIVMWNRQFRSDAFHAVSDSYPFVEDRE